MINYTQQLGDQLQAFYLDYFNNYMTAACIAEHNGITEEHATALIDMGRTIHNIRVEALGDCQKQLAMN
jgi:hypothetical protein